ncbi:hypothetical protein EIN_335520 [Entamoeba invadens IP1]|uniref:Uncharacterized protein n=1 Tax=Entamoeba invadens IP1 TaxID=370355 RepID=L7FNK2_ENTIV|nr:hypothetical protein EIN_335520 [Entamoeba invadens IP1]ELP88570.1 hypothetical protein EIN_335520 [Entamoeba invadens IP1]|eukprot:XP_004255341.1 hypothetical protein EIN_335520 [Entamoeba invadens IP1]
MSTSNEERDLLEYYKTQRRLHRIDESMEKIRNLFDYTNPFMAHTEKTEVSFSDGNSIVDLTNRFVFTLDPPSTRLYDDAISYREIPEKRMIEIGFHCPYFDQKELPFFSGFVEKSSQCVSLNGYREMMAKNNFDHQKSLSVKNGVIKCLSVLCYFNSSFDLVARWYGLSHIKITCNLHYVDATYLNYEKLTYTTTTGDVLSVPQNVILGVQRCIDTFKNYMKKKYPSYKQFKGFNGFIAVVGDVLGLLISRDLFAVYKDLAFALVLTSSKKAVASNRSPLRKFGDLLANYQLVALMKGLEKNDMMKFVAGYDISVDDFKELIRSNRLEIY